MDKNLVLRAFAWTVAITSFFVLALGAVLIAIVVGDWVIMHTDEKWLGFLVGTFVLFGFLVSMGIAIGGYLWLRSPIIQTETGHSTSPGDAMETLIREAANNSARD